MRALIKDHIFWKHSLRKNGLFAEDVKTLYARTQTVINFAYVFFLLVLFTYFFNGISSDQSLMYQPLWLVSFLFDIPSNQLYLFLFYFFYVVFVNSFGKINHSNHLVLMVLFCFTLLPSLKSKHFKEKTLLIFASAQFFLLAAYSFTGFWKLFWGVIEFFQGKVSLFSPLSLRNILIVQFEQTDPTILGLFFLEHYILGWILYLIIVYIEISSIVIFFKPSLHRLWGVLLLILHFGTYVMLGVNMFTVPFFIGVLLLMSPFAMTTNIKSVIKSLPILSVFFSKKSIV